MIKILVKFLSKKFKKLLIMLKQSIIRANDFFIYSYKIKTKNISFEKHNLIKDSLYESLLDF